MEREDCYELLAAAIVQQAADDYLEACRRLAGRRASHAAREIRAECLAFFRSGWFRTLTDLEPEVFIHQLDLEAGAGKELPA